MEGEVADFNLTLFYGTFRRSTIVRREWNAMNVKSTIKPRLLGINQVCWSRLPAWNPPAMAGLEDFIHTYKISDVFEKFYVRHF